MLSTILLAAAGDPYTPAQLATDITTAAPTVLGFAGAAVGAGVATMLALVGLRKGVSWARSILSKG